MRTGANLADLSAAVALLNVVAIDARKTNKETALRMIFVIVVTSDSEVNFPGLTSGAFLRIRTVFVRKVPPASFPRKREPSFPGFRLALAIASVAGMTFEIIT